MYPIYIKRFLDFAFSLFLLIALSPLFFFLVLFLSVANHGQVFFIQERPGKDKKIFKIFKFKTMNDKKDSIGKLLPDNERLTSVGRFIRSTSLDELPQLLNILKGDMSWIGPRPLLVKYLPLYNSHQLRRMDVKPGLTGWAQVNGRNAISWKEKLDYDVWYVDHISFGLDIKIILMTIKTVLFRKGISSTTSQTMEAFTGNN